MTQAAIDLVRHIFEARADHMPDQKVKDAWADALIIFESAVSDDIHQLIRWDYLFTLKDVGLNKEDRTYVQSNISERKGVSC